MRKIYRFAIGLILIQVIALGAFVFHIMAGPTILDIYLDGKFKEDLSFTFKRCDDDKGIWKDSISEKYWEGDDLIVRGYAVPNCGTSWMFGDFHLSGDHLSLKYKPIMPALAACVCAYDVTYQISGLEKKEYTLSIGEEGGIFVEDSWYYKLLGVE